MIPVVTPEEMGEIDAAAPGAGRGADRTGRRGRRPRRASACWGARYGRRVVVVAGKGNNGNDGRAAARRLARRGVAVRVVEAADVPARLPDADLVIDAAYGTGFRGSWAAPDAGDAAVLAVDIPSGVDGLTGAAGDGVLPRRSHRHVRRAQAGPAAAAGVGLPGEVEVADIGLDVSRARSHARHRGGRRGAGCCPRAVDTHKWHAAVAVVAGSPGMIGRGPAGDGGGAAGRGGLRAALDPGRRSTIPACRRRPSRGRCRPLSWAGRGRRRTSTGSTRWSSGRAWAAATPRRPRCASWWPPRRCRSWWTATGCSPWPGRPTARGAVLRDRPAPTRAHAPRRRVRAPRRPRARARTASARRGSWPRQTGAVVLLKGPTTVVAEPAGARPAVDRRRRATGHRRHRRRAVGHHRRAARRSRCPAFEAAAAGAWLHGARRAAGPGPRAWSPRTCPACCPACWSRCDRAAGRPPAPGLGRGRPGCHRQPTSGVLAETVAPAALWVVVKADGYGHGAAPVARAALEAGAEGLCVALVQEGVALRQAGILAPILRPVRAARGPARRARALAPDGHRVLSGLPRGAGPRGTGGRGRRPSGST